MISRQKKILFSILATFIAFIAFYKFMTSDRNYSWAKEFEEGVKTASKFTDFTITKTQEISVDDIELSLERRVKIKIQKLLSRFGLMNYGKEFGETILLNSSSAKQLINCKAWCLGDHIIGIEIEYQDIEDSYLINMKREFNKHFDNYKIIWTELSKK